MSQVQEIGGLGTSVHTNVCTVDMITLELADNSLDFPDKGESVMPYLIEMTRQLEKWVSLIQKVHDSNAYNFEKCRININNTWNITLLTSLLREYHDKDILEFLQFGFPVEHDDEMPLEFGGRNHKGATDFADEVDKYLEKELALGGTIGPFDAIPFKCPVGVSPLSTRPKKNSSTRRVIMDCSWPVGASLNDGMSKDMYLSRQVFLWYPTVDTLAKRVFELKESAPNQKIFFFKEDMDRAFRQLRADPRSVPLLGFKWRGRFYFDLVMVMGCRIAPYVCQRTTDMIAYVYRMMQYFILNYVDDFISADYKTCIYEAHATFLRLMDNIGASRSEKKSVPPPRWWSFRGTCLMQST